MTGTTAPVARAEVRGPIEGGRGVAYASSIVDLEPYGYTESEFTVTGSASRFAPAPGTTLTVDGRWRVEPGEPAPYTTRILVRRPPAERFTGTVVVEFMQEYFGTERDTNYRWNAETLLREGIAWVGASLHHEGVDKVDQPEMTYMDRAIRGGPALTVYDPERYAGLRIPHSDLSYDMLSQIGRAVGPDRSTEGVDPLGGLEVRTVLAVGNTVAADRLRHYIDAVHPLHGVFDGFYLQDLEDSGIALAEGLPSPVGLRLRADCDVPVVVLNTTRGLILAAPQDPHERLRIWEPAGSAHTTGPFMARTAAANKRDFGTESPVCPPEVANTLPVQCVSSAALMGLARWAAGGDPLPAFPRIEIVERDGERTVELDEFGNPVGGLRTPWVDVPIARYDWSEECMGAAGRTHPFPPEQLDRLYGTPAEYRRRFAESVREAQVRGVLLPEDARQAIADAQQVDWTAR